MVPAFLDPGPQPAAELRLFRAAPPRLDLALQVVGYDVRVNRKKVHREKGFRSLVTLPMQRSRHRRQQDEGYDASRSQGHGGARGRQFGRTEQDPEAQHKRRQQNRESPAWLEVVCGRRKDHGPDPGGNGEPGVRLICPGPASLDKNHQAQDLKGGRQGEYRFRADLQSEEDRFRAGQIKPRRSQTNQRNQKPPHPTRRKE